MPTRIFRSEMGFQPFEAFGSSGAFSKPGIAFCCAYAPDTPSAAAATLADCRNERRDKLVVAFESFFISQFGLAVCGELGTRKKNRSFTPQFNRQKRDAWGLPGLGLAAILPAREVS